MPTKLEQIKNYIDFIKNKPKETKWFFLDADKQRVFVVSGHRLKLLPLEYAKYYKNEEFFVQVNPDEKKVMYYAWDEQFVAGKGAEEHTNTSEGFMDWDKVEDSICAFLTHNLKDLTTSSTPFADMDKKPAPYSEMGKVPTSEPLSTYRRDTNVSSIKDWRDNGSGYSYYKPDYGYNSAEYKEKDAFVNTLTSYIKEGKTTTAIDFISTKFDQLNTDKRFDMIDSILTSISFSFDKLNIQMMITLLRKTREAEPELKRRKEFTEKVKTHLTKISAVRAAHIVDEIEAG